MTIEAMKQALEALELEAAGWDSVSPITRDAITALIAAIEEAGKQEPVAWIQQVIEDLHALHDTELIREIESGDALIKLDDAIAAVEEAAQRYTAQRQWQGLTDEEIADLYFDGFSMSELKQFAHAIEAKLKEKNT